MAGGDRGDDFLRLGGWKGCNIVRCQVAGIVCETVVPVHGATTGLFDWNLVGHSQVFQQQAGCV